MFKRIETCSEIDVNGQIDARERTEATLRKLQILKSRISELRVHCEELQKASGDGQSNGLQCDECGKAIEPGQEVEAKNFGEKAYHYHRDCFRKLWNR